jgi:hypothetical protein
MYREECCGKTDEKRKIVGNVQLSCGNVEKERSISTELNDLSKNLSCLENYYAELETVLNPIVRKSPPEAEEGKCSEEICELTSRLQNFNSRIGYINSKIVSLLQRIEL